MSFKKNVFKFLNFQKIAQTPLPYFIYASHNLPLVLMYFYFKNTVSRIVVSLHLIRNIHSLNV